jgi:hypothetical protein
MNKQRISCAVVVIAGLSAVIYPSVRRARESAHQVWCICNLKQLGLAMCAYHHRYDCFPPACVADESGKPLHSWRVLLLPFLDQDELYREYRFDEPWNGPHNRRLVNKCPKVFQCSADRAGASCTSYVVVCGRKFRAVRKVSGPGGPPLNALMIVEVAESKIAWIEPRDLEYDRMSLSVGPPTGNNISSHHPQGVTVADVSGHVFVIDSSTGPDKVRDLLLGRD